MLEVQIDSAKSKKKSKKIFKKIQKKSAHLSKAREGRSSSMASQQQQDSLLLASLMYASPSSSDDDEEAGGDVDGEGCWSCCPQSKDHPVRHVALPEEQAQEEEDENEMEEKNEDGEVVGKQVSAGGQAMPKRAGLGQATSLSTVKRMMMASSSSPTAALQHTASEHASNLNISSLGANAGRHAHVLVIDPTRQLHVSQSTFSAVDLDTWVFSGRKKVLLHELIDKFDKELPWITFGVVVGNSEVKVSHQGGEFLIWTLSNLNGYSVSVFLYSKGYGAYCKLPVGTVVALLSPVVQIATDSSKNFSLVVSQEDHAQILGLAADFRLCKMINCVQGIDSRFGTYCATHNVSQLKRLSGTRMDIASGGMSSMAKHSTGFVQPVHVSRGKFSAPWDVKVIFVSIVASSHECEINNNN